MTDSLVTCAGVGARLDAVLEVVRHHPRVATGPRDLNVPYLLVGSAVASLILVALR